MNNELIKSHVYLPSLCEARKKDNYKVVDNPLSKNNICHVYFSSNGLYYPNTDESVIFCIESDRYEWQKLSPKGRNGPARTIYIRDVYKQWYAKGINEEVNTVTLLSKLLVALTEGYKSRFIGTSSGGYAAVLFGSLCSADEVITIAGQFDINHERREANPHIEELAQSNLLNIVRLVEPKKTIYICPCESREDVVQYDFVKGLVETILIRSNLHGVPVYSFSLSKMLNSNISVLRRLAGSKRGKANLSIRFVSLSQLITKLARKLKQWL